MGKRVDPGDAACLACFLWLWVIPMGYRGLTRREGFPGMPKLLEYLQNSSCIFTDQASVWSVPFIQAQFHAGGPWVTLKEEDYFQLLAFGYRTRLEMAITASRSAAAIRTELARWIRDRHIQIYPSEPEMIGVRFVMGMYRARQAAPEGSWQKPTLASFDPKDIRVESEHFFVGPEWSQPPKGFRPIRP